MSFLTPSSHCTPCILNPLIHWWYWSHLILSCYLLLEEGVYVSLITQSSPATHTLELSPQYKPREVAGMSRRSLNAFLEVGGLDSIAEEAKKNGPQWHLL